MGKKVDRIVELEERLSASDNLLSVLGALLEVSTELPVTPRSLGDYIKRFTTAIKGRQEALAEADVAGDGDDDVKPAGARGGWNTFDDLVDQEVDRIGGSMVIAGSGAPDPSPAGSALQAVVKDVARELGVDVEGLVLYDALVAIRSGLSQIKSPGDIGGSSEETALTRGDSLADAMAHGRKLEHELRGNLTDARAVINRVAAAMQIDCPPDEMGAKILARVQHYETWKHFAKRRIDHWSKQNPVAGGTNDRVVSAVVAEVTLLLSMFLGDEATRRLLARQPAAASPALLAHLEKGSSQTMVLAPLVTADILIIRDCVRIAVGEHGFGDPRTLKRARDLGEILDAMLRHHQAPADVVEYLNVAILPTLRPTSE